MQFNNMTAHVFPPASQAVPRAFRRSGGTALPGSAARLVRSTAPAYVLREVAGVPGRFEGEEKLGKRMRIVQGSAGAFLDAAESVADGVRVTVEVLGGLGGRTRGASTRPTRCRAAPRVR